MKAGDKVVSIEISSPNDCGIKVGDEFVVEYVCNDGWFKLLAFDRHEHEMKYFRKIHPCQIKNLVEKLKDNPEWIKTVPEKIEEMEKTFTTEAEF